MQKKHGDMIYKIVEPRLGGDISNDTDTYSPESPLLEGLE